MASDARILSSNGPEVFKSGGGSMGVMVKLDVHFARVGCAGENRDGQGGLGLAIGKRDRLIHSTHVHSHGRRGGRSPPRPATCPCRVGYTRQRHGGFAVLLRNHLRQSIVPGIVVPSKPTVGGT